MFVKMVTVYRQEFSELKMPYDTVVAADFADLESEASAKSVTGTRYEWTVTKNAHISGIFLDNRSKNKYK